MNNMGGITETATAGRSSASAHESPSGTPALPFAQPAIVAGDRGATRRLPRARPPPVRHRRWAATSETVWIDLGDPAGGSVGTRFSSELAERSLRSLELPGPLLILREFVKQPTDNTVLFIGRKRRRLREGGVQRAGHDRNISNVSGSADVSPIIAE